MSANNAALEAARQELIQAQATSRHAEAMQTLGFSRRRRGEAVSEAIAKHEVKP